MAIAPKNFQEEYRAMQDVSKRDTSEKFNVTMVTAEHHYARVNELLNANNKLTQQNRLHLAHIDLLQKQIAALNLALADARYPKMWAASPPDLISSEEIVRVHTTPAPDTILKEDR